MDSYSHAASPRLKPPPEQLLSERLKGIALGEGEEASVASDLVALLEAKPEGPWDE